MGIEHLRYNHVTVKLVSKTKGEYIISNIQTKGLPGANCECHLKDITIECPIYGGTQTGSVNNAEISASGTVNLIDYKNSVFNFIRESIANFIKVKEDQKDLTDYLPQIIIKICCFDGERSWYGNVTKWSTSFTGGVPTLSLEWGVYTSKYKDEAGNNNVLNGQYNNPKELIDKIKNLYDKSIPLNGFDGNEYNGNNPKLLFISSPFNVNINNINNSRNKQLSEYLYVISNCVTDDNKLLSLKYDDKNNVVQLIYKDQTDETANKTQDPIKKYIFVQNGSYEYYKPRKSDGKIVIPMSSFNFSADLTNTVLTTKVINNPNGTQVSTTAPNSSDTIKTGNATTDATASANETSAIKLTFECSNIVNFESHLLNSKVEYEIFDEHGKKSLLSGSGTVTKCTLTVSGAVVKANIECTEVFGTSDSNTTDTTDTSDTKDQTTPAKEEKKQEQKEMIEYLRREDDNPIPYTIDQTDKLLYNGKFAEHVDNYLNLYFDKTGTKRNLNSNFIDYILTDGDFGLLALLIAVANHGVEDPQNLGLTDDPVTHMIEYKNRKPFLASDIGKKAKDHKPGEGGLGIAHWDAENLQDIYTTIGFDPSCDKNYFTKLLLDVPKKEKDKKKYTGIITGWRTGSFKNEDRVFPIFQKHCYMRRFDYGLSKDEKWEAWAKQLLEYNGPDGRIYQQYLFQLWVKTFWIKSKQALANAISAHKYIQDLVRISRAGNSASSFISQMAGQDCNRQYEIYDTGKKLRDDRQKSYCKRCNVIIEAWYKRTYG